MRYLLAVGGRQNSVFISGLGLKKVSLGVTRIMSADKHVGLDNQVLSIDPSFINGFKGTKEPSGGLRKLCPSPGRETSLHRLRPRQIGRQTDCVP